ncbi:MAG: cysteine--tRNA ligase [Microbacteriaceae bacterium]|nr:cysteine--tRNA ligase [Microbacteriaceae bacterium]
MTVRLYDSKSQTLTDLVPVVNGQVGIYVCGPTVQSAPHIGHLRSALAYDLWRRWLNYRGYAVTLVRNVTDIDDKILAGVENSSEPWWALAYRVEVEFTSAYARLGIRPPTYEPRATASVQNMLDLIAELIERGHAYPAPDASGDVYFDTASWPNYGELTRQKPADMEAAPDADPRGKRDARDFALWKGYKPSEPASAAWASPWGPGRPGWHIECSAMAQRYLGDRFDIHGGGLDLRFPHHENELAQSNAAGLAFANHWVHNGLITVGGAKMSKSLGNSVFAAEFIDRSGALAARYYLSSAHYRSTMDYSDGALGEAVSALERIGTFLRRAERGLGAHADTATDVPHPFSAAMDDDLAIPQALAVLHERTTAGNAALDADDRATAAICRAEVVAMVDVLGINPLAPEWQDAGSAPATAALDTLVRSLIEHRELARADRDFASADRIRDQLAAARIQLEDTPTGSHWRLES